MLSHLFLVFAVVAPTLSNPIGGTCVPPSPDDCDHCKWTENKIGVLKDPCSCGYYQCIGGGFLGMWSIKQMNCAPCTCWSEEDLTCERAYYDEACWNSTEIPIIRRGNTCQEEGRGKAVLEAVNGMPTKYRSGGAVMECAPRTHFNLDLCTCIHGGVDPPREEYFCLSFNDSIGTTANEYHVAVTEVISDDDGMFQSKSAKFNGNAFLEIPFFANNELGEFSFLFYMKLTEIDQNHQILMTNACNESEATILLQIATAGMNGRVRFSSGPGEVSFNGMGPTAQSITGDWIPIALTYDKTTLRLFVDGTEVVTDSAYGRVTQVHCPLIIGYAGTPESGYKGLIDEFCYYDWAVGADVIQDM